MNLYIFNSAHETIDLPRNQIFICQYDLRATMITLVKKLEQNPEIQNIYHCTSVCSFSKTVPTGTINQVKTIYEFHAKKPPEPVIVNPAGKIDLLAFPDLEVSGLPNETFKIIADYYDRYSYTIAFTCQLMKKKLNTLAYVIRQGNENWQQEAAAAFSSSLHTLPEKTIVKTDPIQLPEGAHFSHSQKHIYAKYVKILNLKGLSTEQILNDCRWTKICDSEPSLKRRAQALLEELENLVSPEKTKIKDNLQTIAHQFNNSVFNLRFPANFEVPQLQVELTFDESTDLAKQIQKLQSLPYEKIFSILNGNES
ncbi:MAG: hypothetical protein KDK41_09130 [Leptospiraceae bacterium]|nr:hypothetical protein [Leptospiraceae bacterium]